MQKIGLVPAAGFGTRIAPLPCSKEIYPLGFRYSEKMGGIRPKVACHYLLEKMAKAGANKAYMILRPEKWDIPFYLRSGKCIGLNLAYMIIDQTSGAPFTIDHAFHFVKDSLVLFGFPDIIFSPDDAFVRMLGCQENSEADIVLGLYRAHQPHKMDMIRFDDTGHISDIIIKPSLRDPDLEFTWINAVWTSTFTRYMHGYLSRVSANEAANEKELYVGDVIRAGLQEGITVETVIFDGESYVDIGTPEDLTNAVKKYANTGGI